MSYTCTLNGFEGMQSTCMCISKHLLCGYFDELHDALHLHSHILSPHMPVQLGIDHNKLIGIDNRHSFTVY